MDLHWILIMSVIATSIHLSSGGADPTISSLSSAFISPTASSGHVLIDPARVCRKGRNNKSLRDSTNLIHGSKTIGREGRGRHRRKVRSFCTKEPEMIREARRGSQIATKECQFQFRQRHWNCSALPRSIRRILSRDSRESSFVHAITAAGVTFQITVACSSGQVQDCPCDRTLSGKSSDGTWKWGGCGDNILFSNQKSKDILDIKFRRRNDIRSLMLLHNNEAGRWAVKNNMKLVCKCHGLSGSCSLKTCWQRVPSFREIGEILKVKFDGAVKVIPGNDGKSLIPAVSTIKPPENDDLIYFDESQDFCRPNKKTGSLGTRDRICNVSSMGVDGCNLLCCGRGHKQRTSKVTSNCRCSFKWGSNGDGARVECDKCTYLVTTYYCR